MKQSYSKREDTEHKSGFLFGDNFRLILNNLTKISFCPLAPLTFKLDASPGLDLL